jgi:hypothetical protein
MVVDVCSFKLPFNLIHDTKKSLKMGLSVSEKKTGTP